mmetsp:Transcript_70610/g.204629  ORF Transcript_70610/g.204629 Transcript_70610/m.204629 type:complete len:206 (+) Transcript_70610:235-852(+)
MVLLVHAHDRAVPVILDIASLALDLRVADLAHLRTFLVQLQANILLLEQGDICLGQEVDKGISDTMCRAEVDRQIEEVIAPLESAIVQILQHHIPRVPLRDVPQHDRCRGQTASISLRRATHQGACHCRLRQRRRRGRIRPVRLPPHRHLRQGLRRLHPDWHALGGHLHHVAVACGDLEVHAVRDRHALRRTAGWWRRRQKRRWG